MSGKSPDAFRTISEVADWLDRPAHVLRFWESKFNQIKPVKRAGGRRYYRPEDMLLLGGIKKLLHDDGMTIKGAQKVLREQGVRYVSALSQPLDDDTLPPPLDAVPAEAAPQRPAPVERPAAMAEPAERPAMATVTPLPRSAEMAPADPVAEEAGDPAHPVAANSPAPIAPAAAEPAPESTPESASEPHSDIAPVPAADDAPEPVAAKAAPAQAQPAPLGADLPPPPDLEAIQPAPGILGAIAARRGAIPAGDRAALVAILHRLDTLSARMSAARKG